MDREYDSRGFGPVRTLGRRGYQSYSIPTPGNWGAGPARWHIEDLLNDDIADYWGWIDFELTWRADFGLQLETHTIPASEGTTFAFQATYPLSRLWRPLNFYALVDYRSGAGETILQYDTSASGFIFGIALSR